MKSEMAGRGNGQRGKSVRFSTSKAYFTELSRIIGQIPHELVDEILSVLLRAYQSDNSIYLFGNGGSAALAQHMACDLGKGTLCPGARRFRVISLTDNMPLMTAWANDSGYEDVFAEQLLNLVRPGDIAFAISGSGNSPNVLKALCVAREAGAFAIGLGGFAGGKMIHFCDLCLVVPADFMQLIEDAHLAIAHAISIRLRSCIAEEAMAGATLAQSET